MIFCTLFNSNYLDKGLVLCDSLNHCSDNFKLYIFAFDDLTYDILSKLNIANVIPVKEEQFLDEQLREVKKKRTRTEYCWTCTPAIIQHVLEYYNEPNCTYIDADMCFYKSPEILWREIEQSKCNVSIIEHRFSNQFMKSTNEKLHGKYCVQFNTFINNEEGRRVLEWWKQKCIESCTMELNEEGFGDQKYLDQWKPLFGGVHEIEYVGAGVAPWNFSDYKLLEKNEEGIRLLYRKKQECDLIFFHYQNLKFIDDDRVDIGIYNEVGKFDDKLLDLLYNEYAVKLAEYRRLLKDKFHFQFTPYESRKGSNGWKYTGIKDLLVYIVSFINSLVRSKKNIRKLH